MSEIVKACHKDAIVNVGDDTLSILSQAVSKGADVESLRQLVDLHERVQASRAKIAYTEAMSMAKSELPATAWRTKRVDAGGPKYSHAELGGICEDVVPILSRHGLSYGWSMEQKEGKVSVTCTITHTMGHSESVTLVAPPDSGRGRNDIQAIGSTCTYLQRYTLKAALGIAEHGQDDDGRARSTITDAQAARLESLSKDPALTDTQRSWIAGELRKDLTSERATKIILRAKKLVEESTGGTYVPPEDREREPGQEG